MPAYERVVHRFNMRGVNLQTPVDVLPDTDYMAAINVRAFEDGGLTNRPGQTRLHPDPMPDQNIHSIRRLNNNLDPNDYIRVVGAGTSLYRQSVGNDPVLIDGGYSGYPLTMTRFRPENTPQSWMYIADGNKQVKLRPDGTIRPVGYFPPNTPPDVDEASSSQVFPCNFTPFGVWGINGFASPPLALDLNLVYGSGIVTPLYDNGVSGWGTFYTTFPAPWFQEGQSIRCNLAGSSNEFRLHETHTAIENNVIASIEYDSGLSGLCTISLAVGAVNLARNSVVLIGSTNPILGGGEFVRVLSVSRDPNGIPSFRCSLIGTWFPGTVLTGVHSFRAYTPASESGPSVRYVQTSNLTAGVSTLYQDAVTNLTRATDGSELSGDDYIHISLGIGTPANVSRVRVMFDVSDTIPNDFTRDYFYAEIPAADLPEFGSSAQNEIFFRISSMVQVGDKSLTLANTKRIGIEFTVAGGGTSVRFGELWVGGGHGPDVELSAPSTTGYYYRFRYRDSETGAKSVPSPANRNNIIVRRDSISVVCAGTDQAGVDSIDIERLDPSLQTSSTPSWRYVATVTNPGINNQVTYIDSLSAAAILNNPALETNVFKPFPTQAKPFAATGDSIGTIVKRTGGGFFNENMVAGALIRVGSITTQVYRVISIHQVEVTDSVGTQTGVPIVIDTPIIAGTVLPIWFREQLTSETGAFQFALGDPDNPGRIYWCNGNDLDSASDANYIEVTSPSEPLVSGEVWQGYVFCGSEKRLFIIKPSFGSVNIFTPVEIPCGSGIWRSWAVCVGPDGLYYLGRDGIYRATPYYGGQNVSQDLWPLFPHEGRGGITRNGFAPIDMSQAYALRLSCADSRIYFDYLDTNGTAHTWVSSSVRTQSLRQDQNVDGWAHYTYGREVQLHYQEELGENEGGLPTILQCTNTGLIMLSLGQTDDGDPMTCQIRTGFKTMGDPRSRKFIGDQMVNANPGGSGSAFALTWYSNNNETPVAIGNVPDASVRTNTIVDINAGKGILAYSWSLLIIFQPVAGGTSLNPQTIYEWECSYIPKPVDSYKAVTDWTDDGYIGAKLFRGCVIECDTTDIVTGVAQARNVKIEGDQGATVTTNILVNQLGQSEEVYTFDTFIAHEVRLVPQDSASWRIFKVRWIYDQYPEYSKMLVEDFSDQGEIDTKYVRGLILEADTSGVPTILNVQIDGSVAAAKTFTANHSGRVEIPYAFDPPFIAHSMRLQPLANLRIFQRRWIYDTYPELSRMYSSWSNGGTNSNKYIRGARVKCDTDNLPVVVNIQRDGGTVADSFTVTANGQTIVPLAFSTPFNAYLTRLVPQGNWRLFDIEWIFDEYPDLTALITAWQDAGYPGAKWLQGVVLRADSGNNAVAVTVEGDDVPVIATILAQHNGQSEKAYSWTPVITHMMRLKPQGNIRIFDPINWVFEPSPELAQYWTTQAMSNGFPGFATGRDFVVTYQSNGPVLLTITCTNGSQSTVFSVTLPATAGTVRRHYQLMSPIKGRLWTYSLTGDASGFRLFQKDTHFRLKPWGADEFDRVNPVGGMSAVGAAKI